MNLFHPSLLMTASQFVTMLICALPLGIRFFSYNQEAQRIHSVAGIEAYDRYHTLLNRQTLLSLPLLIIAAIMLHQGVIYVWFFTR